MDRSPEANMAESAELVVVGAGASGCMAAIAAAEGTGRRVLLLEGGPRPAAKIYATGNGRCNLTNLVQTAACYHCRPEERSLADSVLNGWPNDAMMDFFSERGVLLHDRDGYVYPRTDQASTVAACLLRELDRLQVEVRTGEKVRSLCLRTERSGIRTFLLQTGRNTYEAQSVILACGGLAGPQYGCDGSGYRLAASLGHTVREPLPALVPLRCRPSEGTSQAAGIRCIAEVRLLIDGREAGRETGEILFTDYGLSGIPVLQISGMAAGALREQRQVELCLDLLSGISEQNWEQECARRLETAEQNGRSTLGDWLLGLCPDRLQALVLGSRGLVREKKVYKTGSYLLPEILRDLRSFRMEVTGTQGPDRAQTTAGGIPLAEVSEEMSSRLVPGLWLTGEMLDVDGICGGYNLRWAFTTGRTAGRAAASALTGQEGNA